MVDTVSKRRTHYEVLGLTPTATSEEIERAFAREFGFFRPHTVGGLAEVTVAYEALRNPAKRRAYDALLGLEPEAARQSPMTWRVGGQVLTALPVMRPAIKRPVVDEPQVEAQPEPRAQAEVVPFIAAALRELASPEPLRERLEAGARPRAEPPRQLEAKPNAAPKADEERRVHLALDDGTASPVPWKRVGIVVGALTAAVALLGAWAGWESVSSAEPAESAAKAVLPPPTSYTVSDPAAAAPDRVLDDARPMPARRHDHAATRAARTRPTSRLADLERGLAAPDPAPVAATAGAIGSAEGPADVAARLPLPNRVIARTIERIGYSCGQVASATASGTPGVFKVTCTSGHSYQAAPVRGRYHFRRLGNG